MSEVLPDLFDRDRKHAPAAQALRTRKRELFCQQVAGECWGNNTEAYCRAFGATDRDAAGASAARLMRDERVKARIVFLRDEAIAALGVDRLWILQKRKNVAEHSRNFGFRLHALDAIEKSLGLDAPMKLQIDQNTNVNVTGIAGVLKIENPAEFARMMEAIRAGHQVAKPPIEAEVVEPADQT